MAAPTVHTPILNVSGAQTIIPSGSYGSPTGPVATSTNPTGSRYERRSLYIRNYAASAVNMYIAFGQTATNGTNGEFELIPGGEYSWNGLMPPLVGNVPIEYISVYITGGSATGCVVEFI